MAKLNAEIFFNGLPSADWAEWYLSKIPDEAKAALLAALLEAEGREKRLARWRGDGYSLNVLERDARPTLPSRYFPIYVPQREEPE